MAITTLDGLLASYKTIIPYAKTNSITTVAGLPFILIDRAGFPVAGLLNPGNTSTGLVPTDATTGYPLIDTPNGSDKIYVSRVDVNCPVGLSVTLFDVLFIAGQTTIPTSGTTTIALTSRPTFPVARVPFKADGTTRDYSAVELYIMLSVAGSNHAHTTSIDYLDQGGAAGNTGNQSTQNLIVNRLIRCPLAAGDTGVSEVTGYNVNGIASAAGAVSVLAMRRIGTYRCNFSSVYGADYTGLPDIQADSALMAVVHTDATSSSLPSINIQLAYG